MCRTALAVTALAALTALATVRGAHLEGWDYYLEDTSYNPQGTAVTGLFLAGVNTPFVFNGLPYNLCVDSGSVPPELAAAVNDWESSLPGTQFAFGCGGDAPLRILHRSVSGDPFGCGARGAAGCANWTRVNIPQLNGVYSTSHVSLLPADQPYIWVNDTFYQFTSDGLRYIYAHELGHHFGLHEAYLHNADYDVSSLECNPAISSVMNMLEFDGPFVSGGCEGESPTFRDALLADILYRPLAPTITSSQALGSDLIVTFDEGNYAEGYYYIAVQRSDGGGGWQTMDQTYLRNTIAPIGHTLTWSYSKPAALGEGTYRTCIAAHNWVFGYSLTGTCTTGHWLSDDPYYDRDGDGFSDIAEAGTPFCRNVSNDDTADDSRINDGCPAYGGLREMDGPFEFQCDDTVESDIGDDARVNDGCPAYGAWSEADYRLGTDAYSDCPATGTPNDEDVDAWPPDSDDSRTVSVTDVLALKPVFGQAVPPASPRFDLAPSGSIGISDTLALKEYFGTACS